MYLGCRLVVCTDGLGTLERDGIELGIGCEDFGDLEKRRFMARSIGARSQLHHGDLEKRNASGGCMEHGSAEPRVALNGMTSGTLSNRNTVSANTAEEYCILSSLVQ